LFHNYLETGFFTGMPRIPAPESNLFLLKSLLESIVQQFIPYVIRNTKDHVFFLLSYPILLLFFINNRKLIFANNLQDNVLPIIFIIVGLSYFSTLVFLRWVSHFDNFCFRLLAPASFLIFIGVINIVEMTFTKKYFDFIKNFILIVAGFSWVYNVPYQLVADYKTPLFAENIVKLQQEYSGVESDSVVVFAPVDLKFLRTDVILTSPFTQPYSSINEKWNDFINRINPDKTKNIYLAKIDAANLEKYDQTVKDFVNHQSYETIFKEGFAMT